VKKWRVIVVSLDGTTKMFGVNAHIVQTNYPTFANVHAQHSHANGGQERSKTIFENLQEVKAWALIMCSSYIVFQCYVSIEGGLGLLVAFFITSWKKGQTPKKEKKNL
jgi:hypothetical protein